MSVFGLGDEKSVLTQMMGARLKDGSASARIERAGVKILLGPEMEKQLDEVMTGQAAYDREQWQLKEDGVITEEQRLERVALRMKQARRMDGALDSFHSIQ